jgi:hypothetical protein
VALTLVEAAKLSNDILQAGVIELLAKDDPILERLPFKDIVGNGLTYNVETTRAGADFYSVGDTWVEKTSTVTSATAKTTILGGDADVDNFLKATRSDVQDLMQEQIASKTLQIKDEYLKAFFYGYSTGGGTDAKKFDGLHYLIRRTSSTNPNAFAVNDSTSGSPAAASIAELEKAVDAVIGRPPDLIVMTKQCRRNLNTYLNGVGGMTSAMIQGKTVQTMFDIPIGVSDSLSNDEACDSALYVDSNYGHDYADGTALANNDNGTTVFVLSFGPDAVCGLQSLPITVKNLGPLETKDADRVRIKWYPSLMLQKVITASKYSGISNAAWTVS